MKMKGAFGCLAGMVALGFSALAGSGTVTVVSTNYLASVAQSLTVAFDEHANVTNGLWVAWDEADRGPSTNGWANVAFVRTIAPETTRIDYALPSGWGESGRKALRFFLSEVPYDVDCTLASIASTGTQYLAFPNYTLTGRSVVEMDCALNEDVTGTHPLFCSRQGVSTNQFTLFALLKDKKPRWRFDYYWTGTSKTCSAKPEKGTRYAIVASAAGLYVDGTCVQASPSAEKTFTCDGPLTVLAHHGGNVAKPSGTNSVTLYSFKVTDAVCLHLVPAVKAGVVGVCDAVSGQFYGPSGTGVFTAGARVEPEEPIFAASEVVGPIPMLADEALVFKSDADLTDEASHAEGKNGLKIGEGLVTLTGANDFAGRFTLAGGALAAAFGQGLGAADNLTLTSGAYAPLGDSLTAALGTGAGEINLSGGGVGFSAVAGDLSVDLGGAAGDLAIGSAAPGAASPLILNDARGTHTLTLANRIVAAGDLAIATQAGRAVLAKGATVGGAFVKTGEGALAVSGAEAAMTLNEGAAAARVVNGTFALTDGAAYHSTTSIYVGCGEIATSAARLIVSNATLDLGKASYLYLQAGSQKGDDDVRAFVYDGAQITAGRINISRGELRMFGGTIITDKDEHGLTLGGGFEACRLFGGTLVVRDVRVNGIGAAFEWRGGAVRAMESRGDFFDNEASKVRVGMEGGVFETPENVRLSIGRVINPVGGDKAVAYSRETAMTVPAFRKIGAGILGFACKNQYLCATEVHEGTLKLWASNAVPTNGLLRLTGGTLWLNGGDQTVGNLVGSGTVRGAGELTGTGTLTVKGEIVPTGTLALNEGAALVGKVVFPIKEGGTADGLLTSTDALDLAGLDLVLENAENLPETGRLVLAKAPQVSGAFRSVSGLPNDWRLVIGPKRVTLTRGGLAVMVR